MEEDELTLSDVHVGRENVATDRFGVMMTRFVVNYQQGKEPQAKCDSKAAEDPIAVDDEGDFILDRKTSVYDCDVIYIYHAMSTKLNDVGLQVWAGCLLLCDFIINHPEIFHGKKILELGAGTGLASIVAAREAQHVFCTDIGDAVLDLCQQNIEANNTEFQSLSKVTVKEFNWENELSAGSATYEWSSTDLEDLKQTDIILAADVIYSQERTQDLFKTIQNLCQQKDNCKIYIALEQRLNFTLTDLEVSCPAYNFFLEKLQDLIHEDVNSDISFKVRQEPTDFPQYFEYNRTKYLELWYISSESKGRSKVDFG